MAQAGVGSLAVLDSTGLIGIVTDRDLVRRVLAHEAPLDGRVDGVMSSPVVTVGADSDLREAFTLFRTHGIRRLAVVRERQFVGLITVDDLLVDLASDLVGLTRPIRGEIRGPHHDSGVPATR